MLKVPQRKDELLWSYVCVAYLIWPT